MKKLHWFLWGALLAMVLPAGAQKLSKEARVAQQEKSLAEAEALLESRQFEVEL